MRCRLERGIQFRELFPLFLVFRFWISFRFIFVAFIIISCCCFCIVNISISVTVAFLLRRRQSIRLSLAKMYDVSGHAKCSSITSHFTLFHVAQ